MAYGGTVNPPRNRKGGAGNPPPTGARASALPNGGVFGEGEGGEGDDPGGIVDEGDEEGLSALAPVADLGSVHDVGHPQLAGVAEGESSPVGGDGVAGAFVEQAFAREQAVHGRGGKRVGWRATGRKALPSYPACWCWPPRPGVAEHSRTIVSSKSPCCRARMTSIGCGCSQPAIPAPRRIVTRAGVDWREAIDEESADP